MLRQLCAAFLVAGVVEASAGSTAAASPERPGIVELHVHLDGSMSVEYLYEVVHARGLLLPELGHLPRSVEELADALLAIQPAWKRFDAVNDIVGGDPTTIRRTGEWFADFQADFGVAYTEVRFDPYRLARSAYANVSIAVEDAVAALQQGLVAGGTRRGVEVHQLLCAMRGQPAAACFEVAELAAKMRSGKPGGVVGLDLAGDELHYPNEPYVECFRHAKLQLGLNTTVHAGEMVPEAEAVRSAVADMLVDRVGHGYSAVGNASVMELLQDTQRHVEACPYSAGKRGLLSAIDEYRKAKLNFGLNTDDPSLLIDNGNYSDILDIVRRDLNFTDAELRQARDAAMAAAFAPHAAVVAAQRLVV